MSLKQNDTFYEHQEENALIATEVTLLKPQEDTQFAHESAKVLVNLVKQNGWSRNFGGKSEHLQYEAWQTLGKYYGYTVKTGDSKYIEIGDYHGFEAVAKVIDNKTGIEIGGAEAACLTDEPNWAKKPLFQLKSMAQTRAGSKALRQILGFVVALAGYSPTPAEEMIELPSETLRSIKPSMVQEAERVFNTDSQAFKEAQFQSEGKTNSDCTCGTTNKYHSSKCPLYVNMYANKG